MSSFSTFEPNEVVYEINLLIVSRFFHLIFCNVTASGYWNWSFGCDIMCVKSLYLASHLVRLFTCEIQL